MMMTTMSPIAQYYDRAHHDAQAATRAPVLLIVAMFLLLPFSLGAQETQSGTSDLWERAVDAMQHNRLEEAIPLLESIVPFEPTRVDARRYLALGYEQTGRTTEAEEILREGVQLTEIRPSARARLAFDLAALLQRREEMERAIESYGVSLQLDPGLASSYLNRANVLVSIGGYDDAVSDYRRYLALRPDSAQRPEIERMIALLTETIAAEEQRRVEEERRLLEEQEALRIAEEEARRREEIARQEEAARRQAMLDAVLESLNTAGEEAETFQIENEDIETYEEELDILD